MDRDYQYLLSVWKDIFTTKYFLVYDAFFSKSQQNATIMNQEEWNTNKAVIKTEVDNVLSQFITKRMEALKTGLLPSNVTELLSVDFFQMFMGVVKKQLPARISSRIPELEVKEFR